MYKYYNQAQKLFIILDEDTNFPKGSFIRFLNDFIEEQIDTKPFEIKRKNNNGGAPAKHVKMMLKIIFYAFSQGIYSMRKIASKFLSCHTAFIYLSGYQTVNHSTLSRFINYYLSEIQDIFTKILYITNNLGYVTKNLIAIDGCKIKANASKKFTGNYAIFEKKKKTYEKMIAKLLERANRIEDSSFDKDKEIKNIGRLKNNYENSLKKINSFLKDCDDKNKKVNLTDKDSCLMEKDNKYFSGYNCQTAVNEHGLIAMNDVVSNASDRGITEEMVMAVNDNLKDSGIPETKNINYLMDKGYHDSEAIGNLIKKSFDIYIPFHKRKALDNSKNVTTTHCKIWKSGSNCFLECPGGRVFEQIKVSLDGGNYFYKFYVRREGCKDCKYCNKCIDLVKKQKRFVVKKEVFDNLKELNHLREKMDIPFNKDIYNKRLGTVEPVFGTICEHRGFKKFLVRGIEKVQTQWNMVCSSFNLRRLFKLIYS